MATNLVKVCKASNARMLAFAYLSRSHGRLYETCHFSGLVELSSLGKRRQKYHLGSFPSFSKSDFLNISVLSVFLATFQLLMSPLN